MASSLSVTDIKRHRSGQGPAVVMLHCLGVDHRLWDHAAGSLLVREAGGFAATFREDDFDAANPWRRQVIAALNPDLFVRWRDWLRQHGAR